jgi:hypothetical protein
MYGTIKITLGHKTRKDRQLKVCKTMALPCLMYGKETWTQMNRRETAGSSRDEVSAVCCRLYCMGHGKEGRNKIRTKNEEDERTNTITQPSLASLHFFDD